MIDSVDNICMYQYLLLNNCRSNHSDIHRRFQRQANVGSRVNLQSSMLILNRVNKIETTLTMLGFSLVFAFCAALGRLYELPPYIH